MRQVSKKVLIVGSGAREHAIAYALNRSASAPELFAYPGNPGMFELARPLRVERDEPSEIVRAALRERVDLVVVGPEAYLERGLVNLCREAGIAVFGPTQEAAKIETSKSWAKQIMDKAGVPTASYVTCTDMEQVRRALDDRRKVAVKADSIAAGKGVLVTDDRRNALDFASVWLRAGEGSRVVIEDALEGPEVSLFALVSGETVVPFGLAQDYKRAYDGNEGPNTGGMGAISPVALPESFLEETTRKIVQPAVSEMARQGAPYTGALYAGLMLTDDGPSVIEFNARFGDPEAQVLMPRLRTDLLELLDATANDDLAGRTVEMDAASACGVAVASAGYPVTKAEARPVTLGDAPAGTILFHAGTSCGSGGALQATGGRVFTAVGLGANASEARSRAYSLAERVSFGGAWYRKDIGK